MAGLRCDNCDAQRGAEDIFCESCGLDFLSGSLPEATPEAAPGADPAAGKAATGSDPDDSDKADPVNSESPVVGCSESAAKESTTNEDLSFSQSHNKLRVSIEVDRSQFDKVVQDNELPFPDPIPAIKYLDFVGTSFHIGRTSESRAIHPDMDIMKLTNDEAVSSRHALIELASDQTMTITDLGSTNGTTVGAVDAGLIVQGKKMALEVSSTILLGAWTKITILDPTDDGSEPDKN